MKIRKHRRWKRHVMMACAGILVLAMGSVGLRFSTRQILVKKLHMDNRFTRAVLFDQRELWTSNKESNKESKEIPIDWQKEYPFSNLGETKKDRNPFLKLDVLKKSKNVLSVENKISDWTSTRFIGYPLFLQIGEIYGSNHNFGNQNADDLLNGLTRNGIPYIDLREDMNKDFSREEYHKLFFSTDHHWKQTTALWATGIISQKLNKDDGFSIDTTLFSREMYLGLFEM